MSVAVDAKSVKETSDYNKSGHFMKGRLYGKGEIKYRNGDEYTGFLKGSKRHGDGKMKYIQEDCNHLS